MGCGVGSYLKDLCFGKFCGYGIFALAGYNETTVNCFSAVHLLVAKVEVTRVATWRVVAVV